MVKPKVIQTFSYVIVQEFYSYALYIYIYNPFCVEFCESNKVYIQILFFSFFVDVQLLQHHLLKRLPFLCRIAFASLSRSVDSICVGPFLDSHYVPLIYLSILLPIPQFLDYCIFVVSLEVEQCQSSDFVHLLQRVFGYYGSSDSPIKLQNQFVDIHRIICWHFDLECI